MIYRILKETLGNNVRYSVERQSTFGAWIYVTNTVSANYDETKACFDAIMRGDAQNVRQEVLETGMTDDEQP